MDDRKPIAADPYGTQYYGDDTLKGAGGYGPQSSGLMFLLDLLVNQPNLWRNFMFGTGQMGRDFQRGASRMMGVGARTPMVDDYQMPVMPIGNPPSRLNPGGENVYGEEYR